MKDSWFSYAGGGSVFGANAPTMDFNFADIPVTGSVFTNNASTGGYVLDFSGNSVPPEFRSNYIVDNGGAALGNVPFGALDGFRNNVTANNGAANGADGNLLHAQTTDRTSKFAMATVSADATNEHQAVFVLNDVHI